MTVRLPLLEQRTKALETCGYCPKLCRASCPVSSADRRDTVTPWGKMSLSWLAARGDVPPDRHVAGVAWACTGCLACTDNCDHDNPVAETLLDARADAFSLGLAPGGATQLVQTFDQRAERARQAARELGSEQGAPTALVIGCDYLRRLPEVAADAVRLARALVGPVRVSAECCGQPLLAAGDRAGFARQRRRIAEELAGVKRVVVVDPGCARTLDDAGPELLLDIAASVLHRFGRAEDFGGDGPVRWHDPCHLGRGLGRYDAPRALLTRAIGRAPDEFSRRREDATCSGAGALLPLTMPETSERIARARRAEHDELGGGLVVTACAGSLRRFRAVGVTAVDLMTVLAASLGRGNGD